MKAAERTGDILFSDYQWKKSFLCTSAFLIVVPDVHLVEAALCTSL